MRIAVVRFTERTIQKFASRAVTPDEMRQVNDGDRVVLRNPRLRVEGTVLMIGPTFGGRVLTVALNPKPGDPGAWHVRTAWTPARAEEPLPQRTRMTHHVGVGRDDEVTSDELDGLLDEAETINAARSDGPTEMRLYVPVNGDTLHALQSRAADAGVDVESAAAEVLRAGAQAA